MQSKVWYHVIRYVHFVASTAHSFAIYTEHDVIYICHTLICTYYLYRAIPVVEGVDQEASSGITVSEVELAPLLAMDPNTSSLPRYLMLMKNPDQAVNIGISVESLGSQNTRTLQEAEARIARRSSAANPRPRPPPGPGQTGNAIEMTAATASLVSGQQRDMGENPVHNPNQYHNPPPARPVHRGGGMSEDRSFQQVGIHAHEQDSLL